MGTAFICTTPTQLQDEPHLSQPLIFTYNTCCINPSMNNTNSKPMDITEQQKLEKLWLTISAYGTFPKLKEQFQNIVRFLFIHQLMHQ